MLTHLEDTAAAALEDRVEVVIEDLENEGMCEG